MIRRLTFVFLSSFSGTMLLSERSISRIFLKPNQLWFKKNDRLTSEENGRENAQNDKTIINTIHMKLDFPIIKKIVINMNLEMD